MKTVLFISTILLTLFSCKKEINKKQSSQVGFEKIRLQLKDSLPASDFELLDFDKAISATNENEATSFVRIGFRNIPFAENFILLKLDNHQEIVAGKKIHLKKVTQPPSLNEHSLFNGYIAIDFLNGSHMIYSAITNGYINAFSGNKPDKNAKETVQEVPLMPDVLIVSTYPKNGGYTSDDLYNLQSMANGTGTSGSGTANSSGYYSPANFSSNSNGIFTGSGSGSSTPEPILIDFETGQENPAIDVNQYIKCFSSIPDAGATCTLKILTDIPVDKDPNVFFDWGNGSPGHTFLQFTKTNGSISVQQNIGFYPDQGWKTGLTPAPVKGKFVDNASHEFNASLAMPLSPEKFQTALTRLAYLARFVQYDIDDYNCTDFALEVFNRVRVGNEIIIPMYDIPGGAAPRGTSTPGGLYQTLKTMKSKGDNEAKNILFPGVKGFAGSSKGPCN
jgi:hypothetical protein